MGHWKFRWVSDDDDDNENSGDEEEEEVEGLVVSPHAAQASAVPAPALSTISRPSGQACFRHPVPGPPGQAFHNNGQMQLIPSPAMGYPVLDGGQGQLIHSPALGYPLFNSGQGQLVSSPAFGQSIFNNGQMQLFSSHPGHAAFNTYPAPPRNDIFASGTRRSTYYQNGMLKSQTTTLVRHLDCVLCNICKESFSNPAALKVHKGSCAAGCEAHQKCFATDDQVIHAQAHEHRRCFVVGCTSKYRETDGWDAAKVREHMVQEHAGRRRRPPPRPRKSACLAAWFAGGSSSRPSKHKR